MNGGGLHFMNPTSFFFMWWDTGLRRFDPNSPNGYLCAKNI